LYLPYLKPFSKGQPAKGINNQLPLPEVSGLKIGHYFKDIAEPEPNQNVQSLELSQIMNFLVLIHVSVVNTGHHMPVF
jgi:hypothetical protein